MTEDPFKAAAAAMKAEREEEENSRGSYNFTNRENVVWRGCENNEYIVGRIVGMPDNIRTEPWHCKSLFFSKVLNDRAKGYINVIWPQILDPETGRETGHMDTDWILYRLVEAIKEREWQDFPDGPNADGKKGKFIYHHENSLIYKRITTGNKKSTDTYVQTFMPSDWSKKILIPWIDRHDSWCSDNKHTKVLTGKLGVTERQGEDPIYHPDHGVPYRFVYSPIMEELVSSLGDWTKYDIAIKRVTEKKGNRVDVNWRVTSGKNPELPDNIKSLIVQEGLTDEEKSYKHFNLDEQYSYCSYQKLYMNIKDIFKKWDEYAGTKFFEELKECVEIEKKERKEKMEQAADEKADEEKPQTSRPSRVRQETPESTPAEKSDEISIEEQCKKYFPKWDVLNDGEKSCVVENMQSIDPSTGKVVWKDPSQVLPCEDSKCSFPNTANTTELPADVYHCPVCGIEFKGQ